MSPAKFTAKDVAEWMLQQLEIQIYLYQESIVYDIGSKFGEDFIYVNASGNHSIDKAVLKEFSALTGDTVVWVRSDRMWRKRESYDAPGRMQS